MLLLWANPRGYASRLLIKATHLATPHVGVPIENSRARGVLPCPLSHKIASQNAKNARVITVMTMPATKLYHVV